jgi:hypothetical protein
MTDSSLALRTKATSCSQFNAIDYPVCSHVPPRPPRPLWGDREAPHRRPSSPSNLRWARREPI